MISMVTKLTLLRWSILFFDSIVASLVFVLPYADGQNYITSIYWLKFLVILFLIISTKK